MNTLEQKSNSRKQHICCQIFELVPFCIVIDVGKYWCRVYKKIDFFYATVTCDIVQIGTTAKKHNFNIKDNKRKKRKSKLLLCVSLLPRC